MYKTHVWAPAIHLDNRYRLMRGEQMLDKDGNPTDQIGEDETAGMPIDLDELFGTGNQRDSEDSS